MKYKLRRATNRSNPLTKSLTKNGKYLTKLTETKERRRIAFLTKSLIRREINSLPFFPSTKNQGTLKKNHQRKDRSLYSPS